MGQRRMNKLAGPSRRLAVAVGTIFLCGCVRELAWPKEPLHVVIDNAPDAGPMSVRVVGLVPVATDRSERVDAGCTSAFPFRSFATALVCKGCEPTPFHLLRGLGLVVSVEVVAMEGAPLAPVRFLDGDQPIPRPGPNTFIRQDLRVEASGEGKAWIRASGCAH